MSLLENDVVAFGAGPVVPNEEFAFLFRVALAALGNSNANFFFGAGGGVAGFDGFLAKKAAEGTASPATARRRVADRMIEVLCI